MLILFYFEKNNGGKILVTWEEPDELEKYIAKLHKAAEILTNENRKLRKQHGIICGKV